MTSKIRILTLRMTEMIRSDHLKLKMVQKIIDNNFILTPWHESFDPESFSCSPMVQTSQWNAF